MHVTPCMQNTEESMAKYAVDANLFRLGSNNTKKISRPWNFSVGGEAIKMALFSVMVLYFAVVNSVGLTKNLVGFITEPPTKKIYIFFQISAKSWLMNNKSDEKKNVNLFFKSVQIYMKDAECFEMNKKSNFKTALFEGESADLSLGNTPLFSIMHTEHPLTHT